MQKKISDILPKNEILAQLARENVHLGVWANARYPKSKRPAVRLADRNGRFSLVDGR